MEIPEWLILLREWQILIFGIAIALYRPAKYVVIKIYNNFVHKPDIENETEITLLRNEINKLRDEIKTEINLINEDVTEISNSLDDIKQHRSSVRKTHKALLHNALFEKCQRAIKKGSITPSELDNINGLYKPYKAIGGNGTAEKLYSECKSLPLDTNDKDLI